MRERDNEFSQLCEMNDPKQIEFLMKIWVNDRPWYSYDLLRFCCTWWWGLFYNKIRPPYLRHLRVIEREYLLKAF